MRMGPTDELIEMFSSSNPRAFNTRRTSFLSSDGLSPGAGETVRESLAEICRKQDMKSPIQSISEVSSNHN